MKPSSFQKTIEKQFDYICMCAIKDERKNYMKHLSRLSKREVSFSTVGDKVVNQFAITDQLPTDYHHFSIKGFSVQVENEGLSEALKELSNRKREILLLHYFLEMSDSEIADLLNLNRSTVYRHRKKALEAVKQFMEEESE